MNARMPRGFSILIVTAWLVAMLVPAMAPGMLHLEPLPEPGYDWEGMSCCGDMDECDCGDDCTMEMTGDDLCVRAPANLSLTATAPGSMDLPGDRDAVAHASGRDLLPPLAPREGIEHPPRTLS